jgi:hypothetical protein
MLDDHWRALEAAPVPVDARLRVVALPVVSAAGALNAAVDAAGLRHLLIPLGSGEALAPAAESALRWRLRPLEDTSGYRRYADLGCYRPELNEVFTGLCAEILVAVETRPERPLKTARGVVEQWRALFSPSGGLLGPEQLAGLFGELTVLARLLDHHGEAGRLWAGPSGDRHDFHCDTGALEVKASTATEGRRVRIHGLDQLERPFGPTLDLVWIRLERTTDTGRSVPELVDEVLRATDDEHELLHRLAAAGYRPADRDRYAAQRFRPVEERWYPVDDGFPRLTAGMFGPQGPPAVLDVHYTVDLMPDPVRPLTDDEIRARLVELTRSLG